MFKCLSKNKGFTLIELLVTAGIIALLSAIVLPNYRNMDKQYALNLAANKLVQDIRSVQEMALAAAECKECIPPNTIPPRYGIYAHAIGSDFYMIFADYPSDDGKFWWDYDSAKDVLIKKIYYGSNIILVAISGNGTCSPSASLRGHITFSPPDPATDIWIGKWDGAGPQAVPCAEIIITLRAGSDGPTKSVKINKAGLIYVQ